jgi:hypothetical protein
VLCEWLRNVIFRGGVVGWRCGRRGGFDLRLALFALETVEFVTQALGLALGSAQVGSEGFNQIEQATDEDAGAVVGEAAEIKRVKHWVATTQGVDCEELLYPERRPRVSVPR